MTDDETARHFIDGAWSEAGELRDSIDPATGDVIGRYVLGTTVEAEQAIDAARTAFRSTTWRADRERRARVLNRMADAFEARMPEVVALLGLENGKVRAHGESVFEKINRRAGMCVVVGGWPGRRGRCVE